MFFSISFPRILSMGFGLCGLSAAMFYAYFKARDDGEEEHLKSLKLTTDKMDPRALLIADRNEILCDDKENHQLNPKLEGKNLNRGAKQLKKKVKSENSKSREEKELIILNYEVADEPKEICEINRICNNVKGPISMLSKAIEEMRNSISSSDRPMYENLMTENDDEDLLEVYVSAVSSPSKFWVQRVDPQSRELEELMEHMKKFYSFAENRATNQIYKPYLGQIVAAFSKNDSNWNRAEVVAILRNKHNQNEVIYDLFFVDCGENNYMTACEIFELRGDFLALKFQAIECFLANVKSTLPNCDDWEEQSIVAFEEYTQVACQKKLGARVVTHKNRVKSGTGYSSKYECSIIPGLEIYEIEECVQMNLGHKMISNGYAYPSNGDFPHSKALQVTQTHSSSNVALTI